MSLYDFIRKKIDRRLFTTPSHSQKRPFSNIISDFYDYDYSEIEGFDDLSSPRGILFKSQLIASELYSSKFTFYLTNGSTSGIIAAVCAVLEHGDSILVARNSHRSVFSSLVIANANPIWIMPEYNSEWDVFEDVTAESVEDAIIKNPSAKALLLTSPTYFGKTSDISMISHICKKHGVYLIVDEAHGALFNFCDELPIPSIKLGADISVNSLHKNAGALTPAAVLHISKTTDIDVYKMQAALNLFTTSSPSYPLLANIDSIIRALNSRAGRAKISRLIRHIAKFQKKLSGYEFYGVDPTKILIKTPKLSGADFSEILYNKYSIEDEMATKKALLFLTGIGTDAKKINYLRSVLSNLKQPEFEPKFDEFNYPVPKIVIAPNRAYNARSVVIKKTDAVGKISGIQTIKSPPGFGIIYPGELITEEHLPHLDDYVYVIEE